MYVCVSITAATKLLTVCRMACRTLHTAEDAAEGAEKWVFQLWLCAGLPIRPKVDAAAMAAQQMAAARKGGVSPQKPKRSNKKKR
jgi:hypothetical protein